MNISTTEQTNDTAENVAKGAIKYDAGKAPVFRGAIDYFPRAIGEVAQVSAFGASKYAWKGWEGVPDGYNRYSDALVRHLIYEGEGEVLDPDSGLLHAAHAAWNALARLELLIRQRAGLKTGPQNPEKTPVRLSTVKALAQKDVFTSLMSAQSGQLYAQPSYTVDDEAVGHDLFFWGAGVDA